MGRLKKPKFKVVEVNYGVSSVYPNNIIEVNEKLTGRLKNRVLAHEKRHSQGKYGKKDFINDFQAKNSHFFEVLKVALKNKEMLIGYFLVMYSYYFKIFTWNNSALFPFIYFGLLWGLFWGFLFQVPVLQALIGWVVVYSLINLSLLIYTHLHVLQASRISDNS